MPTAFHELDDYISIPRVTSLRLSPDGTWLAASVQALTADRNKYATSIWRIDPGGAPARRLTRSAEGEGSPRFLPDGSLLFISRRPDPDQAAKGDGASKGNGKAALWLLPPDGGEARVVATLPGGITAAETGTQSGAVIISGLVLDAARASGDKETAEADERLREQRAKAGVSAVLHESSPVRFWDSDLGPDDTRLFAVSADAIASTAGAGDGNYIAPDEAGARTGDAFPRDLTPDASHAFIEHSYAVSTDGAWVATNWYWWHGNRFNGELAAIEVATGNRTVLLSDPDADFHSPGFAPDGSSVACVRTGHDGDSGPGDSTLLLVDLARGGPAGTDGGARDLLAGFDRWPADPVWDPEGRSVYFLADDGGRRPVYRVDVATGTVTRVTPDDGHYAQVSPAPDGTALYALRDAVGEPPAPVRIDLATGVFERLPPPCERPEVPGRLTEVEAMADDGHPIRAWLVLPDGASADSPAPLLLWVHGGPRSSWNSWQWRWNPWLMAARGYAVLLPDPALSTGYGLDFVKRGYRVWGPRPYADLMAITDAAVAREDIDAARTAVMGGSYGGYMANWIAGHTDRFQAIVSHASVWAMDQMLATTDVPIDFHQEFGGDPEVLRANSPHLSVASITTPMLVIHGARDYRVPLGEALRLWWDLQLHGKTSKFLYFPDENHWVLSPGNIKAWYGTVLAFLAEHVLREPWKRPDLL